MQQDMKIFWYFLFVCLCKNKWPQGQGHNLSKLGRVSLGHATYQMGIDTRKPVRQRETQTSLLSYNGAWKLKNCLYQV